MIRVYPILPISAPRQVARDKFKPSNHVLRYRAFRDEVRIRHVQLPRPFHHVIFILPVPNSWSTKQKQAMEGMPHEAKPDRDNLEKALLDSVYGEDQHVWDGRTTKLWGQRGMIIVSREQIPIVPPFDLRAYYIAATSRTLFDAGSCVRLNAEEPHAEKNPCPPHASV